MKVKKSLYKFLNDNLTDVFVSYNSDYSDIKRITSLYSQQTLSPLNTSDTLTTGTIQDITGDIVTGNGTLFASEFSVNDTIKINGTLKIVETINSNTSLELSEGFSQVWNIGDVIYKPSGKEFVALQGISGTIEKLDTSLSLNGWKIYLEGESVEISNWDSSRNQLLLAENTVDTVLGYDYDLEDGSEFEISSDKWIFMKKLSTNDITDTRLFNYGAMDRWDFYVKTKDDSDKDKIDTIIQSLKDLFFKSLKFPIYDTDLVTVLAYASIVSWSADEIIDNNNDLQSYLVSIQVRYFRNYI